MDKIIIEGGHPLKGQVTISGAKNAVLPVLAATLLTQGKNEILEAPQVRDVNTMVRLVQELGVNTDHFEGDRVVLDTAGVNNPVAPYELVSTMRASCLVLGPLLARLGEAKVSLPGGCAIGARPIDLHIKGLLGQTLVVLTTESDRTPRINDNDGRDHHNRAFPYLLAGGGIKGGQPQRQLRGERHSRRQSWTRR